MGLERTVSQSMIFFETASKLASTPQGLPIPGRSALYPHLAAESWTADDPEGRGIARNGGSEMHADHRDGVYPSNGRACTRQITAHPYRVRVLPHSLAPHHFLADTC